MSSLKDSASLIMIPSLYKDGRLDTIKPLGNSILHPDATGSYDGTDGSTPAEGNFTFSRGSNLAATRVDVNGLIEKGRENLLLQSNQFDTTWTSGTTNASVTSGQSDPNGGSTAWLVTELNDGGSIRQSVGISGVLTFSMYLKYNSGAATSASLFCTDNNQNASFNLSTGVVNGLNNLIDASMVDVGGGWYRCSVTFNASAASTMILFPNNPSGVGSCFAWNAQVETGLVPTDYIETGASTAQAGILEDMPRLDYSGGASCPSLLLEPQRTNLIPYSEYWTGWFTKDPDVTISVNAAISPDGTQNAGKLSYDAASRSMYKSESFSGEHTFSFWVKAEGSNIGKTFNFRLRNTSLVAVNHAVPLTGEWVRHDYQYSDTNLIEFTNREGTTIGTGGFLLWGIQLEQGSYPTSYIPTYGTSQTRSKDFSNNNDILGTAYSSNNFSYFIEFKLSQNSGTSNSPMLFGGGSTGLGASGQCYLRIGLLGNNTLALYGHGDILMAEVVYAFIKDTNYKVLVKRSGTDVSFFVNGVQIGSTQTSSLDFTLRSVGWSYNAGAYNTYGDVKQFVGFETALTDSECIALTTL